MSYASKRKKEQPWLIPLLDTVFIGYTDIAAAGSRSLFGVAGNKDIRIFEIPELSNARPCTVHPKAMKEKNAQNDKPLTPLMVYNCTYMQYSLLIINMHVPPKTTHAVVKYIVDSLAKSFVHRVFLLSALRLDIVDGPLRRMYENTWNGMAPGTNCHALPSDTKFCDAFLSNFIQMLQIESVPFSVLSCPAHKAEAGHASELDGSAEVIATMQEYLGDITHIGFSLDISSALVYDGNPGENADMVAMIYV